MYYNKYLKYKIKYLDLLIKKKGGSNENIINISCKIDKSKKLDINDNKYDKYDIYECFEKNNYLNELEIIKKNDNEIKKSLKQEIEILLAKLRDNKIYENKLNILEKQKKFNKKKLFELLDRNQKLKNKLLKNRKEYDKFRDNFSEISKKKNKNEKEKYQAMVLGLRMKINKLNLEIDKTHKQWSEYNSHIHETYSEEQEKQNKKRLELEDELKKLEDKLSQKNNEINNFKKLNNNYNIVLKKLKVCKSENGCKKDTIDLFNKRLKEINIDVNLYDFLKKNNSNDKYYLKESYKDLLKNKLINN